MKYFMVEFYYPGPYANFPDSTTHPEMERLSTAENRVELALILNKIEFRHAYSWPDGSLYKYIRTELSEEEITKKLLDIFNIPALRFSKLYEESDGHETISGRTVASLFEKK